MKKTIKIIISVILAICITMTTFVFAFAEEGTLVQNDPATENTETEEKDPNQIVAKMYICATANSLTGHVWLYFTNLTDEELEIGQAKLAPYDSMSVGALRNTRHDGGGIYYNGEAYMARNDPDKKCRHTTSLEMELTREQLCSVTEKIKTKKSLNSYNLIFWNCGAFATEIWNSVSDKKVVHIVLPIFTILNMNILGAQKGVVKMDCCKNISKVFKHKNDGEAVAADEKSFRLSCI